MNSTTLLMDLGNTRLKLGLWHAGQMQFLGAHPHSDETTLIQWFEGILTTYKFTHAYGVSVAKRPLMSRLETVLAQHQNALQLQWVWPEAHMRGVTNLYPNPRQLGADRWAGMLGLAHRFQNHPHSLVLANMGTATTVDTLSRDKTFLGGLILPGVSMMQNALSVGTARLPLAHGEVQDYPTNTHAAITTGIVSAQLGAIRRQIELSTQRDGQLPTLCVSGGAWTLLCASSRSFLPEGIEIVELPHVVLDGLCLVAMHFSDDFPGQDAL